jgi:hypothetical protein
VNAKFLFGVRDAYEEPDVFSAKPMEIRGGEDNRGRSTHLMREKIKCDDPRV